MVGVHRIKMFEIVLGASIKFNPSTISVKYLEDKHQHHSIPFSFVFFFCYLTESLALTQQ